MGGAIHVADKFGKEAFELLHQLQYWNPPEFGYLPFSTLCDSYIELIHKRTKNYRFYVDIRSPNTRIYQQAANGPLHWQDEQGRWRTINWYLIPKNNHQFWAPQLKFLVEVDTSKK